MIIQLLSLILACAGLFLIPWCICEAIWRSRQILPQPGREQPLPIERFLAVLSFSIRARTVVGKHPFESDLQTAS